MIDLLIRKEFSNENILYIEDPREILYTDIVSWEWNLSVIPELKKHSLVIVNYGGEDYRDSAHWAQKWFEQNSINFLLISHSPSDHVVNPKIIYHPYHYFQTRDTSLGYSPLWPIENIYETNTLSSTKKYKLSCLNGNPAPHKIFNFLKLREKSYFQNTYFTIGQRSDYTNVYEECREEWNNIKNSLPSVTDLKSNFLPTPETCVTSPAHTDSYIQLVVETTADTKCFLSEKTWKAIACGQLFLILGGVGIVAHLREIGVDTFDDIIDHNYYDHEPDVKLRITKLHEVIDNLMTKDLELINHQTKDRRRANAEKFWNNKLYLNNYTLIQLRDSIKQCLTPY